MTSTNLRTFVSVVEAGSLSAAAKATCQLHRESAQGGKAEVQPRDIDGGTAPPEEVSSRPPPTEEPSGAKSSRKALASFKSSVSKPSVNQP